MLNRFGRRAVSAAVATIVAGVLAVGGPLVTHSSITAKAATPRHASLAVHSKGTFVVRDLKPGTAPRAHGVMPRLGAGMIPARHGGPQPATVPARAAAGLSVAATAPLALQTGFGGLGEADDTSAFGYFIEPPDPWVAVGPTAVIQSVNRLVRITDRSGNVIRDMTVDTLFGVLPGQVNVADPRILYDAQHDRWIGEVLSYDCANGYLYLAVSQSGDPLLDWTAWYFVYPGAVPDYPGLGSSSDKIVISANEYPIDASKPECIDESFTQSSLLVVDWAAALETAPMADWYFPEPGYFAWRPAPNLSPDPVIHVVGVRLSDGDATYATMSGSVANANVQLSSLTNLTIAPFSAPPAPRQPGSPSTIEFATDGRPTDALWNNGSLWFVSTYPLDVAGETRDGVRITQVLTAGSPTVRQDFLIGFAGHDTFMGGVGIATYGTAYFTYSVSSSADYVSTYASVQLLNDPGNTFSEPVLVAPGGAAYDGSRWGDYVGVARDPAAPNAVWVADEIPDASGAWITRVAQLATLDSVPPTVIIGGPAIVRPSTMTSTAIQSTFATAATDNASGIASQEFERSVDGGAFAGVAGATNYVAIGHRYQFRTRATDGAGNVSPWALGPSFVVAATNEASAAITYRGTWRRVISSGAYGGRVKYATSRIASASYRFSGRAIAWVAPTSRSSGSAKVYVDGVYRGTVSLYSSGFHARRVIFTRAWAGVGTHTIKVVPVGTRGHPRVDIDAFVILR